MKIRVATWNIGGGLIRSERMVFELEDLQYFQRCLAELDADIVCFQEAHSEGSGSDNQIMLLASALGLPNVVSRRLSPSHLKSATDANIGVATRLEVLGHEFLKLPNPGWSATGPDGAEWVSFDKGFLRLSLSCDGDEFVLITGHAFPIRAFGLSEDDWELITIHSQLDHLLRDCADRGPTIFGGDLNLEQPQRCLPSLRDATFQRVLPPGPTTQPLNKQFDHLFATRDFRMSQAGVVDGQADHFLCWVDLEFSAPGVIDV